MFTRLLLPCLLGLLIEVWGQSYPPTQSPTQTPPVYETTTQYHQPGYAPAGYASPAQGHGGYGKDFLNDPTTMMLLMQQNNGDDVSKLLPLMMMGNGRGMMPSPHLLPLLLSGDSGLSDDPLLLMSMMGNKYGGYGGYGGFGGGLMRNPMLLMHLMKNGGLSSNPAAMMAMMGGGKKMNPLLMTALMQCKEEHLECVQPNNLRHEECGLGDEVTYSDRELLPCCTCKKTEETIKDTTGDPDCFCIFQFDPVCGSDGASYPNSCTAGCAGVAVECQGECPCND